MIGEKKKSKELFYYLSPEELIPENHILRLINRYVDFSFIRPRVEHLYSHTGRPSVDPDVMMRMLLLGYLFGITSERRLCEEVGMHMGYRWFVGLSLEEKIPDHSTFSKNRHGRFKQSGIYQQIFDQIVHQCIEKGLVKGDHLTVDSTLVKANASFKNLEPIVVSLKPEQYIEKVDKENPVSEKPESEHLEVWEPKDDFAHSGVKFQYQDDKDEFICPQGKTLRYWGIQQHSKQHAYRASPSDCRQCPVKAQCTRASYRSLSYHIYESSIEIAPRLTQTRGYRISQRMRKRVEELFGEAKECMGMRRMKFRGALFAREQVLLTATAQNIKRMVRLLSQMGPKTEAKGQVLSLETPWPSVCHAVFRWILSPHQQFGPALS